MLALALVALIPVAMWLCQSALLWRAGLSMWVRLGAADLPEHIGRVNRAVTNLAFATVFVAYPLLRGESPWTYYARFLPLSGRPRELIHGAAAAILYLALLYLAWAVSGNVQFRVRHATGKLVRRLAGVPFTAILIAFVEELLFRAVLLADLLRTADARVAVPIGVLVFAAAHYVRRVKRYWTFPGHLALGTLLCLAFVWTQALWLPIGLHAGGVVMLMGLRPFLRYTGPAWLVGASIFSYAGVVGIVALGLLTINMWLCYGGAQ